MMDPDLRIDSPVCYTYELAGFQILMMYAFIYQWYE